MGTHEENSVKLNLFFFDRRGRLAIAADRGPADDSMARITCFAEEAGNSRHNVGPEPDVIHPHVGVDEKGHQEAREEKPEDKIHQRRQNRGADNSRPKPSQEQHQTGKEQADQQHPQRNVPGSK